MANLDDFKKRLQEIAQAVRAKLPEIAEVLTISAKSLAERRVREKGFSEIYSENKIPVWFLQGKELNATGKIFLENKKKKDQKNTHVQDGVKYFPADHGTNWKEFRAAQGLQVAHVDLGYSNKMWAAMGPVGIEESGDVVRAPLGATNREAQNKMNWNRDRYGDFIGKALTPEDVNLLAEVVISEIGGVLDTFK